MSNGIIAYDIFFGRVSPYIPSHKTRKMQNMIPIVSYWMGDFNPSYSYSSSHLCYQVGIDIYKIYNPQKYKLIVSQLIGYIRSYHRHCGNKDAVDFRVILENGGT